MNRFSRCMPTTAHSALVPLLLLLLLPPPLLLLLLVPPPSPPPPPLPPPPAAAVLRTRSVVAAVVNAVVKSGCRRKAEGAGTTSRRRRYSCAVCSVSSNPVVRPRYTPRLTASMSSGSSAPTPRSSTSSRACSASHAVATPTLLNAAASAWSTCTFASGGVSGASAFRPSCSGAAWLTPSQPPARMAAEALSDTGAVMDTSMVPVVLAPSSRCMRTTTVSPGTVYTAVNKPGVRLPRVGGMLEVKAAARVLMPYAPAPPDAASSSSFLYSDTQPTVEGVLSSSVVRIITFTVSMEVPGHVTLRKMSTGPRWFGATKLAADSCNAHSYRFVRTCSHSAKPSAVLPLPPFSRLLLRSTIRDTCVSRRSRAAVPALAGGATASPTMDDERAAAPRVGMRDGSGMSPPSAGTLPPAPMASSHATSPARWRVKVRYTSASGMTCERPANGSHTVLTGAPPRRELE